MKKAYRLLLSGTLLAAAMAAAQEEFADIKNFFRVEKEFCTGGQPSMEHLAKMKEQGVKAVINLRRASEYDAEGEAAKAKGLGLRYFHIPVDGTAPRDEQADEFLKVTADPANRPMFIHCAAANRVGAFWMIRRVLVDKWKPEQAEEEATKIGMRSPVLRDFARDYIARHQKQVVR